MKFSQIEKKDLWAAGFFISFAFAILLSGGYHGLIKLNSMFLLVFLISLFSAGVGFILHELMHKYVAQSYGLFAEFKAFYNMLYLALFLSLFGFIIAAPGAVFIKGRITKEKNGKISLAGPMANIFLSFIFLVLIITFGRTGLVGEFFYYGLYINSLLAVFNMIPVMPFDGAKIIAWNKIVYYTSAIFAFLLFASSWVF